MFTNPKIAIIGAGPSGLTLANLLQQYNISFTVYELETVTNERNQGGTLDLHAESGQLALREAGLYDEFKKNARPEGDALKSSTQQVPSYGMRTDAMPHSLSRPLVVPKSIGLICGTSSWIRSNQTLCFGEGSCFTSSKGKVIKNMTYILPMAQRKGSTSLSVQTVHGRRCAHSLQT